MLQEILQLLRNGIVTHVFPTSPAFSSVKGPLPISHAGKHMGASVENPIRVNTIIGGNGAYSQVARARAGGQDSVGGIGGNLATHC